MNCQICGKPVVLVPSAKERAKRHGGKPSDYTAMFPTHARCLIEQRAEATNKLIERMKPNGTRA